MYNEMSPNILRLFQSSGKCDKRCGCKGAEFNCVLFFHKDGHACVNNCKTGGIVGKSVIR